MGWGTGLAVYFVVWWVVIFMVLPWGVQPLDPEDVRRGQAPSAPKRPRILIKMAVTTVAAGVVWVGIYLLMESGWFSFRS
jgi:predicted secreted protein